MRNDHWSAVAFNLSEGRFFENVKVFREITKQILWNYWKILKKCFLGTTCIMMCGTDSNSQPHTIVCRRRSEHADVHVVTKKHFFKIF